MWFARWRRKRQPEAIGEAEAYQRSYGDASLDVKVIERPAPGSAPAPSPAPAPPAAPRPTPRNPVLETGELLRLAFLDRLERRRGGRGETPPDG